MLLNNIIVYAVSIDIIYLSLTLYRDISLVVLYHYL